MREAEYKALFNKIIMGGLETPQDIQDINDLLIGLRNEVGLTDENRAYCVKISKYAHEMAQYRAKMTGDVAFDALYWKLVLFEAQERQVDSYFLYLEKDRDPEKRFYEPRREKFIKFGVTAGMQALVDDEIDLLGISMPPGSGKLLANDTPVLTADGWKKHGGLEVGDRVYGLDGKLKRVVRVFPKDYADCLVTFTNGEKIVCHENHEWVVYDRARSQKRIMETKTFFDRTLEYGGEKGNRGHRYVIQIPNHEIFNRDDIELPVKPYTLGAWLGDGRNTNPDICGAKEDYAIVDSIVSDGYPISWHTTHKTTGVEYYGFVGLRKDLQKVGMCHSRKRVGKYIPEIYLCASARQRLELLAGLLDTDGTVRAKENKYTFVTAERWLRDSFVDLISTFGWRCSVVEVDPCTSSSGIVGKRMYWTISFSPTIYIPCRLFRKRLSDFSPQRRIAVESVSRIEKREGNCIQVEDGVYCVGRKMIPTHNSTAGIFFLSGCMGWWPEMPNLASAHSGILTRSFYDGVQQILVDPYEYKWHEIFPHVKFNPRTDTNSKEQTINVGQPNRFKSLTCRAINASLTGATRCEKILYADDLCSGIEEALSKERLDKLWQTYNTDLKTRKKDQCKEIHIQTRWSVNDVVGRLQREHEDDPRARFIAIPAYDENGESNFDYKYGVGFSTEYFRDMEKSMDDVSFKCLYMNQPIEREGLLVHEDELRRYMSLPLKEPDAIWSIADTKQKGTDYFFQPVFLQYGEDYYLDDTMCDNGSDYEVQYQKSTSILLRNKVQACQYESNAGGDRVAEEVNKRIKAAGGYCNITQKYTTQNKETKIIVYAPWWKEHVLFKDKSQYLPKSDYGVMMSQILTYPVNGKAAHDDCVDGLSSFAKWRSAPEFKPTRVFDSPF